MVAIEWLKQKSHRKWVWVHSRVRKREESVPPVKQRRACVLRYRWLEPEVSGLCEPLLS